MENRRLGTGTVANGLKLPVFTPKWKSFALLLAGLSLNPTLVVQKSHIHLQYGSALADYFQYQYDPATGRITVATNTATGQVAQYSYDANGNITGVQVTNPSSASLGVTNTGNTATTTYTGQGELLTFAGTTGQSMSLTINYNSASIPGITVEILNPDGTLTPAQSITCPGGGTPPNCNGTEVINLAALPQNGTYQIVVQPQPAYSGSGTLSFILTNRGLNALPAILNLILDQP